MSTNAFHIVQVSFHRVFDNSLHLYLGRSTAQSLPSSLLGDSNTEHFSEQVTLCCFQVLIVELSLPQKFASVYTHILTLITQTCTCTQMDTHTWICTDTASLFPFSCLLEDLHPAFFLVQWEDSCNKEKDSTPRTKDREQGPVVCKRHRSPKYCSFSRFLPGYWKFPNVKVTKARKQPIPNFHWLITWPNAHLRSAF